MKKFFVICLSVFVLMSMVAACSTAFAANKVVKIGVFQALTGENGAGGKQQTLGMQYGLALTPTVEIAGETYDIEFVYADNQSSTAVSPSAAQTLVAAGVSIVLGSYGSGVSIAASDTFGDARIPAIGITNTNPQVTLGNDHYFRLCFLDPFQGTVLAQLSKEKFSAKKAYVLARQGDDYSVGLANYFMEAFGVENCTYEVFPAGTSDYSSYVATAKSLKADVFFSPCSTESAALIIDQAHTQALGIPILAGDTWDNNVVLEAAKGKDVQIFVTTFYQEGGTPAFDAGIKEWIKNDPTNLANNGGNDIVSAGPAMCFDGFYVALEALKKAGSTDPEKVLEALRTVTYDGVTGFIAFDEIGDAKRDTAYIKSCNTAAGIWEFVGQQGIK